MTTQPLPEKSITLTFDSEAIKMIDEMSTSLLADLKNMTDGFPFAGISEFVATLNKLARLLDAERAAYNKLCEDRLVWIMEGMKIALAKRLAALAEAHPGHEVVMVKAGLHLDDVKKDGKVVYINENTDVIHIQAE